MSHSNDYQNRGPTLPHTTYEQRPKLPPEDSQKYHHRPQPESDRLAVGTKRDREETSKVKGANTSGDGASKRPKIEESTKDSAVGKDHHNMWVDAMRRHGV